ncbi:MAG: TetR family transcriptional regulator, partial [Actinobacteria bacterium]|nr:TetR family transcriptional regulator [Actinomycetota bacterium]
MIAKTDLSKAAIVERALDLADAEGLDAVTIRRLGQEFGVTPMALYWHVKNKDELLDAMGDQLFASMSFRPADEDEPWDAQLTRVVRGMVESFRQHPACLELVYRRVFACEEGRQLSEHVLRLLRTAGFTRRQTADIATHSLQTALMLVGSEPGAEPGRSAEDVALALKEKRESLELLPIEQFPYIREMAPDLLHCDDIDAYYDFNVDLFVAGARATLAA